jgi:peptidoglycan/LPS O-acetylase OafA/YrhL
MEKVGVINGLRGFAILSVVYYHLFSGITGPGYRSFQFLGMTILPFTFFANGWFGVNMFFILSGFVLSYPYFSGKRRFQSRNDIIWFYRHRGKRLLPLYYFVTIFGLVFLVSPFPVEHILKNIIIYGAVLFNFTSSMWFPKGNWVLWSLGIEVWFSVVFPFVILGIYKFGMKKVLCFSLIIAFFVRCIGNTELFSIGNPYLNPVRDSLAGRFDEFVWGIFLCHLYVNKIEFMRKISNRMSLIISILFIIAACFLWDYVRLSKISIMIVPFINNILDIGLFLLIFSLLAMEKNFLRKIFENYFLQMLGVMCYSIYVWHGIAMTNLLHDYRAVNLASYAFFLMGISLLSYRYIEFGHVSDVRKLFLLKKTL